MSDLAETLAFQMRAVGLPEPEREYRFCEERRWRFDYAWPALRLAVEVDGWGHRVKARYQQDVDKFNQAALAGWTVLHLTSAMVRDGSGVTVVEGAIRERESTIS